jgi:hypothetical protein
MNLHVNVLGCVTASASAAPVPQLSAAKEALARLRQEHKEAEAALRKNKKRAAQVGLLCGG